MQLVISSGGESEESEEMLSLPGFSLSCGLSEHFLVGSRKEISAKISCHLHPFRAHSAETTSSVPISCLPAVKWQIRTNTRHTMYRDGKKQKIAQL